VSPASDLHAAAEALSQADRIVAFAGAGLSAESGIKTFRDSNGYYQDKRVEELAHVTTFQSNPGPQLAWYQVRRDNLKSSHPNPGHHALARLSKLRKVVFATQNVDNLQELACAAGGVAPTIHHLHGLLSLVKCHRCTFKADDVALDLAAQPSCPKCEGGRLRPGVVWFGEALPGNTLEDAMLAAADSQVCLCLGTSGVVQPAASIPLIAKQRGALLIEVNPEETALSDFCDFVFRGKTGEILPQLVDLIGARS
jgi:NAD-dependent deacetylase